MPQVKTILYIGALLPKRSETFVTSEIFALRALGYRILCASVHPPEKDLGDSTLEALADEAIPIYGMGSARNLGNALKELFARTGLCLRTLRKVLHKIVREPFDAAANAHKIIGQFLAALALAHRIRSRDISHIHAHMGHVPTTIAWITAVQLGIPFSFTGHAADLFKDRCLLKAKLNGASFVSCISFWHRAFYRSLIPGSPHKYPVIRCGVDITRFVPGENVKTKSSILSVGRLVRKKGFDILLNAFAQLQNQGLKMELLIAGEGPDLQRLTSLKQQLHLHDTVCFLGAVSHGEVQKLLTQASLFVLPCRIDSNGDRDGIPVVLMEAMASGIACVSGDLPAIRELITDGHTGRIVSSEDPAVWANVLSALLRNPDQQAAFSKNGRQRIEAEFSTKINIPRLITAFEGTSRL